MSRGSGHIDRAIDIMLWLAYGRRGKRATLTLPELCAQVYRIDQKQVAKKHRVAVLRSWHSGAAGNATSFWTLDTGRRPARFVVSPYEGKGWHFEDSLGHRAARDAQIAYQNMLAGKRPLDVIDLRSFPWYRGPSRQEAMAVWADEQRYLSELASTVEGRRHWARPKRKATGSPLPARARS